MRKKILMCSHEEHNRVYNLSYFNVNSQAFMYIGKDCQTAFTRTEQVLKDCSSKKKIYIVHWEKLPHINWLTLNVLVVWVMI